MHQTHPGITVSTDVLPTPQVLVAVRDGRADAGIARAPAPTDGVRLRPLRDDPEGILVAAGHPLAGQPQVALPTVATYPVVVHPRSANPAHHDFISGLFATRNLHPRFIERDIAFDLSQRTITEGTAVALVSHSAAIRLPPDVQWVPLAEPISVTVALVLPTGDQSAIIDHFTEVALRHAAAHAWLR